MEHNYTNDDIMQAIDIFQKSHIERAIKCYRDPLHPPLYPREIEGKIYLFCSKCNWAEERIEEKIPEIFNLIDMIKQKAA